MESAYYVYFMTNIRNKVLYVGVTGNLEKRMFEHKSGAFEGFTKKYKCQKLVYFEVFASPAQAITREKQIKGWVRAKKNMLVDKVNPEWLDLTMTEYQFPRDPSSQAPQDDASSLLS